MKSAILRFLYLYYNGGVFFDIDFEITKACEKFIVQTYALDDYDVFLDEHLVLLIRRTIVYSSNKIVLFNVGITIKINNLINI